MKRAIATTTIPGNLGEKLQAAADAGFKGVEIFENDLLYFDRRPAEVRDLCADLGLEIVAWQPFRDFESLPAPLRQKAFDRAERKFDLMGELGTNMMLVCSNVSPQALDDNARAAADLAALSARAAQRDIVIGYEALAWGRHVRDYPQAWDIVRAADAHNLGIVLDTFHIFSRGNSLATMNEIPSEKIALVQLADAPDVPMDLLHLSRHHRCFPGQGDYPIDQFMTRLRAIAYEGTISHEIFSDELRSGSPRRVARDGMRSMIWLDEPKAADAVQTPPLFDGVEFVEFAMEETAALWIDGLFTSLGFRKTHRHRTKNVFLYRQGDISLVMNCEPDSFAHSYHERHGISVCAVAFATHRVDDVSARARRFLCTPFENRIAPDELNIPAIRAPDESLIYFVDREADRARFFEVDFVAIAEPEHIGHGLQRIDHIARAVAPADFLSSLMFYRAVLGLEPRAPVDLVDPHGMVTSRALEGSNTRVRVPLNTSQALQSSTQRFLERSGGAGVQHIAFSCTDIFAVAERIDRKHVVHVSENYYDDLAARWALDDSLVEQLRRHHVLYDEDEDGRYFQLYTRSLHGLFFEVVQRDGYTGYGESNAAARIAAQQRDFEEVAQAVTIGTRPSERR